MSRFLGAILLLVAAGASPWVASAQGTPAQEAASAAVQGAVNWLTQEFPGHVFQIVMSNGRGLATDQYLRGADLDGNVFDGNVRLGFNLFRILDFSKF